MVRKLGGYVLLIGILLTGCQFSQMTDVQCTTLISHQWGASESEVLSLNPDVPIWHQYKLLVDGDGNIYILRGHSDRILKFDPSGKFSNLIQYRLPAESFGDFGVTAEGMVYVAISSFIAMQGANGDHMPRAYAAIYEFDSEGSYRRDFVDWRSDKWIQDGIINGLSSQVPFHYLVVDSTGATFSTWGITGEVTQYFSGGDSRVIYDGGIQLDSMVTGWDGFLYIVENSVSGNDQLLKYDVQSGNLVERMSFAAFDIVDKEGSLGLLRAVDANGNLYFSTGGTDLRASHRLTMLSAQGKLRQAFELPGCFAGIDSRGALYLFASSSVQADNNMFEVQKCTPLD